MMSNKGKKLIERTGKFLKGDRIISKNRVMIGHYSERQSRKYSGVTGGKPVYAVYKWCAAQGRFSRRVSGWVTLDKIEERKYKTYT